MKSHLIILHGAVGARDQMQQLSGLLQERYTTHTINFSGHGGNPFPTCEFSISCFADDLLCYLRENNIDHANIFGYSMGGYVALYAAKFYPQFVDKIITLATKFYWNEDVSVKEIKMLDPDTIMQKVPAFAKHLEKRHAPNDWRLVLEKTKAMLGQLGRKNELDLDDYKNIQAKALLLLGDKDKTVTVEETIAVQKAMPNAYYKVLPDTSHPIENVSTELLSSIITDFLSDSTIV